MKTIQHLGLLDDAAHSGSNVSTLKRKITKLVIMCSTFVLPLLTFEFADETLTTTNFSGTCAVLFCFHRFIQVEVLEKFVQISRFHFEIIKLSPLILSHNHKRFCSLGVSG